MRVLCGMSGLEYSLPKEANMTDQKKSKQDKKLSLAPLTFNEALNGLLETEPSKET